MNQVAVRVWLFPEDAQIEAWTLGLEHWKKWHLSQAEWAEMSLPGIYTVEDWYRTMRDADPEKCYELYLEGTMRGSIDHNGEADEEFDWNSVEYRETSTEELVAMGFLREVDEPEEGAVNLLPLYTVKRAGSGFTKVHWAHTDEETACGQKIDENWEILTNTADRPCDCQQCLIAENFV